MQTLYINEKPVQVQRSWSNGENGIIVHLLASGDYTYANGNPVTSPKHFSHLPKADKEKALAWMKLKKEMEKEAAQPPPQPPVDEPEKETEG